MTTTATDLSGPSYVGAPKPHLSFSRIVQMNIGFFGLQFSFGLQQANIGPIYSFLGADEATMPLLWLAGPMTGLAGPARHRCAERPDGEALGTREALFVPMIGIGLGWASLMGCPYIMLANTIPPARTGIYMGIFNMFIVLPMLIETLTMPLIYAPVLGGDARHVLMLGGVFMLIAGAATLAVGRTGPRPVEAA